MKITKQIKIRDIVGGGAHRGAVHDQHGHARRGLLWRRFARMADAGCIRCAVPDMQAAGRCAKSPPNSPLPVVADIHFDYRLALAAIESGVDKILESG